MDDEMLESKACWFIKYISWAVIWQGQIAGDTVYVVTL